MALLVGYGAAVINPYLAFETIEELRADGEVQDIDRAQAVRNYIKACTKGVLKVMSKMGISTLQSYRGAQIFEAVGLDKTFVDRCFTWTASRIGGIGIDTVAEEVVRRHARAFAERGARTTSSTPAASTSGAATASTTCSIPRPSSSCSTPAAVTGRASTGTMRGS